MYYKKRKNNDKKKIKRFKKPKYKITFISLDDPRVMKALERKIYQDYLRDMNEEGGEEDE